MKPMTTTILAAALAAAIAAPSAAQSPIQPRRAALPLTKVVLFSSGVGYFEHRGQVSGDSLVALPFSSDEVNDALKSLVVADGSASGDKAASPSVSYPSRESLDRALRGFRVDLSGAPGLAELLARLRGAEITVEAPQAISGRIVAVERKPTKDEGVTRPFVLLLAKEGLRSVSLDEAQSIRFSDREIGADFERALELILGARDERSRSLDVRLPGTGDRQAAIGYVIAAPVWKASYRLDLTPDKPQLQGWALVDNPTDQDWQGVSLSLVAGRPVSFIQDLYEPLYLERPTIPLAIAGIAAARSFDSGFEEKNMEEAMGEEEAPRALKSMARAAAAPMSAPSRTADSMSPGRGALPASNALDTATAGAAGEQFQFTVKKPVSLERGRSSMLPLVACDIAAERVSVYSPDSASNRPMLGAKLANGTGMRLPAGPIAVFDGGIYAGDALLDFFPEKDSRLIIFGEDLGVSTDVSASSSQETVGVSIAKGVLVFARRITISRTYAFKNATAQGKKIVVEHPITPGAELAEPAAFDEKTEKVYRFSLALPAAGEAKLVVKERSPRKESVVLGSLGPDDLLAYSSSKEIPQSARTAIKKAVELRGKLEDAKRALSELQSKKEGLASDQNRYRENIDSVGRDSSQGQQYLKRLMDSEGAIDQIEAKIAETQKNLRDAQESYGAYLANLNL
jgi:hypothetical protein